MLSVNFFINLFFEVSQHNKWCVTFLIYSLTILLKFYFIKLVKHFKDLENFIVENCLHIIATCLPLFPCPLLSPIKFITSSVIIVVTQKHIHCCIYICTHIYACMYIHPAALRVDHLGFDNLSGGSFLETFDSLSFIVGWFFYEIWISVGAIIIQVLFRWPYC